MQQYSQLFFIVAIVGVFYFLIIRPQQKRKKDQAVLMSKMTPGAEIMTIGGLFGKIVSIDDDRVRIVVADGTEMVFAKNAIAQVVKAKEGESDSALEGDDDTTGAATDDSAVEADDAATQTPTESESADV